jgi:hypothetical protein
VRALVEPSGRTTTRRSPRSRFQRLSHALSDHGRIVVDGEGHGTLESVRPRNENAHAALERVGRNSRFMRRADVLAARDDSRLDTLASVAGDTFCIEDREWHTALL